MTKIDKKIRDLEDRVDDKFEWKSTLLWPVSLTETEKRLFDHVHEIVPPKKLEQIPEVINFNDKFTYYCIRRGVDLFMKTMEAQLHSSEKFLFWGRFIDFVSETMFILNRYRGLEFIEETILGENPDDWPDDDDPRWKELEDAEEKWDRDFKEFWDCTSLTMDKIFPSVEEYSRMRAAKLEEFEPEEKASPNEFRIYKFFAERISIGLSSLSKTDVIMLAFISLSSKEKTIIEIITSFEAEQKE